MIKLKHIVNSVVVSEIDLQTGVFTIGRNSGNSLQLDDGVVSGDHAILVIDNNEYLPDSLDVQIQDLNSTNGTYVNNLKIQKHRLRHNDTIKIGSSEFKLFDENAGTGTQTEYYVPEETKD